MAKKKRTDNRIARGISLVPPSQRYALREELIEVLELKGEKHSTNVNVLREVSRKRKTPYPPEKECKIIATFRRFGINKDDIWGDDINYENY